MGKGKGRKLMAKGKIARMNMVNTSKPCKLPDHEANETMKGLQLLSVHDSESLTEMPNSSSLQDHGTLLLTAEILSTKLESLQIINENLCGENLDSLSLTDLESLKSQIVDGWLSLEEPLSKKTMEQEEVERGMIKEGVEITSVTRKRDEGLRLHISFSKERLLARKKAAELRRLQSRKLLWDLYDSLVQAIEDMKVEISRIQLWNKRMCGKELDGLDYFEMMILRMELNIAMNNVGREIWRRSEE